MPASRRRRAGSVHRLPLKAMNSRRIRNAAAGVAIRVRLLLKRGIYDRRLRRIPLRLMLFSLPRLSAASRVRLLLR